MVREKETWKWIIDNLPGKFRADMIGKMDIQIPGFRKESLLSGPGKTRLTASLLQARNRIRLKLYLLDHQKEIGMDPEYINMNESECIEKIKEGNAIPVLLTLLLQPEDEEIEKGERLFAWMEESGFLNGQDKKEPARGTEGQHSSDTKKIKKLEEKILRLQAEHAERLDTWKEKQQEWKLERQELMEEISRLKSQVIHLENVKKELEKQLESSVLEVKSPKITVALIGDPRTAKVASWEGYSIDIIDGKEVEKAIEDKRLERVEEIWILTFKTPAGKGMKIRSLYIPEKIHEFSTLLELEKYMEIRIGVN